MWISFAKQLPEDYDYVLISYTDEYDSKIRYVPTIGYMKEGILHTREGDVENSVLVLNYFKEHHFIPTHWMSLPKPPTN